MLVYRPFRRPSFSSVESLRHREKKGEIGVKTRNRGDCNWRSYQMFHSGLVVYFARKLKMQILNHIIRLSCHGTLLHLRVSPSPVGDWGYRGAQQPGWPIEGSGEEAQAVRAPASWLFQAVSSPPRHQAYLKDQGHRKGVDLFLSSFCFFVNPCFGMPQL